jgi:NADH-quinone oxidoreductase subunit K
MSIVTLTSLLFSVGLFGVLTRRDLVAVLASVELMLGAANIQIIAFAAVRGEYGTGQSLALLVLVIAAAEAAVGFALLVALARRSGRTRVDELMEVEG